MRDSAIQRRWRELLSLVTGLGVTGRTLFKPTVTVHYPRREVPNLASFRGPIALVPRDGAPHKPRCIACLMCMSTCPSHCITVTRMKAPPPAEGGEAKSEKSAAPKEPQAFIYDYSLCSLCGLCVEVCPVQSIRFSTRAYGVTRDRATLVLDLLTGLRTAATTGGPEAET